MTLRLATPDDARAIARLHAESWAAAYRGMYSDAYLDGPVFKDRRKVWKKRVRTPREDQYVLLAVDGDSVLGFVCAYGHTDERWGTLIDNLHVRPGLNRRGIGRSLLVASARWSRDRYPDSLLHLFVLDANTNARAFYEHLGAQAIDSQTIEPPGGGRILSWRYVWQGTALEALVSHAG